MKATGKARKYIDGLVDRFSRTGPLTGRYKGKPMNPKQAVGAAMDIARRNGYKVPPKKHTEDTMNLADRILGENKAKLGAGPRFKSLEKKEAKKGAKNPAGLAAWIGREKYGKSKFQSLAKHGKKSYSESTTSLAARILEGKKDCKPWNSSDFQTKLKSKKPWGATNFQTAGKGYSEDKAEIFGLVDSLVELRNSFVK